MTSVAIIGMRQLEERVVQDVRMVTAEYAAEGGVGSREATIECSEGLSRRTIGEERRSFEGLAHIALVIGMFPIRAPNTIGRLLVLSIGRKFVNRP